MAYTPYYNSSGAPAWQNGSSGGTPINAAALNNMEDGIITANRDWVLIAEVTTLNGTALDTTVNVTYPTGCKDILFTVQGTWNGRTIASTLLPKQQFAGGACYAFGAYSLACGTMAQESATVIVNSVAIDAGNNQIEIACNDTTAAFKLRVWAR